MTAPTYDLGNLHGGLRLPGHKAESTSNPILEIPVPAQLILPLEQHVGEPAQPIVGVDEYVLKGQLVAESQADFEAHILKLQTEQNDDGVADETADAD